MVLLAGSPLGFNPTHGLQTQPQAPKPSALHGAWCVDHQAGLYLTHTHPPGLSAWAKTRDGFQMWASHWGQPLGGCFFEQRL